MFSAIFRPVWLAAFVLAAVVAGVVVLGAADVSGSTHEFQLASFENDQMSVNLTGSPGTWYLKTYTKGSRYLDPFPPGREVDPDWVDGPCGPSPIQGGATSVSRNLNPNGDEKEDTYDKLPYLVKMEAFSNSGCASPPVASIIFIFPEFRRSAGADNKHWLFSMNWRGELDAGESISTPPVKITFEGASCSEAEPLTFYYPGDGLAASAVGATVQLVESLPDSVVPQYPHILFKDGETITEYVKNFRGERLASHKPADCDLSIQALGTVSVKLAFSPETEHRITLRRCADTTRTLWAIPDKGAPDVDHSKFSSGGNNWLHGYRSWKAKNRYLLRDAETRGLQRVRVKRGTPVFHVKDAPGEPTFDENIAVNVVTTKAVNGGKQFTWLRTDGAIGYDVEYRKNNEPWRRAVSCNMWRAYDAPDHAAYEYARECTTENCSHGFWRWGYTHTGGSDSDKYLFRVRASKEGKYGPWYSLPPITGFTAGWNWAYDGRLSVHWNPVPGASGYEVKLWQRHAPTGFHEEVHVSHHHPHHAFVPTDWQSAIQLCKGDIASVTVRPVYRAGGSSSHDAVGPWTHSGNFVVERHDPIDAPRGHKCKVPEGSSGGVAKPVTAALSGSTLTAGWTPGVDNARWFHVNYKCGNDGWKIMPAHGKWEHSVGGTAFGGGYYQSGKAYELSRLGLSGKCKVAVRAGNERGWAMNGKWASWGISEWSSD